MKLYNYNNINFEIIDLLLMQNKLNLNLQNGIGETLLMLISKKNNDLLKSLFKKNIIFNLNLKDNHDNTILMTALNEKNNNLIKLILEYSEKYNTLDYNVKIKMDIRYL